jgi:hypothetical protein
MGGVAIPRLLHFLLLSSGICFHVVQEPVPHDEETGDDHGGGQSWLLSILQMKVYPSL